MKKRTYFSVIIVLVFSLVFSSMPSYAGQVYTVIVNGKQLSFDVPPKNVEGRLLVPMRALYEELGADVLWDQDSKTVWAYKDNTVVTLPIGSLFPMINGVRVELDVPAELENGRTLVPLRFASESLNLDVHWDAKTYTATITELTPLLLIDELLSSEPTSNKTKEQIKFKWIQAKPTYQGNPYITSPSTKQPYRTGSINNDFIDDGVRMANFVRYLADLPDDLVIDSNLNKLAQHGAILLNAHGTLSHTPPQPADMGTSFYNKGYESTSSSNLAYYGLFSTHSLASYGNEINKDDPWSLAGSIQLYMRDEDDINLEHVGHRRWILNPSLQKIGFGYAHSMSSNSEWANIFQAFSTMQIFDSSRTTQVDYDYVAWPNKGYFPVEFFEVSEKPLNSDPWSISLNPQKFQRPQASNITVTLKRQSDQRVWTLNQQDSQMKIDGEYFNVSVQNIGIRYCIIFRPNQIEAYSPGDVFQVEISGLKDLQGNNVEVKYNVDFFSLK